jgi:hypothetical protein
MPVPAPNSEEALERVNALARSTFRYLDGGDIRLRALARLGRELMKSDAGTGWSVLASIAAFTGNVQEAIENADRALRLTSGPSAVMNKSSLLSSLGYISEAGKVLKPVLSAQLLPMRIAGELAIGSGLVRGLDDALSEAGNMPTAVPKALGRVAHVAASILRRNSVSDDDVGLWLDKAGDMLRERRLVYVNFPILFATEEEGFGQVDLSFEIDVDSHAANDLNAELVRRLFSAGISPPDCFSFGFKSRHLDGRLAA